MKIRRDGEFDEMGRFEQDMRDLRSKTLQSLPPPPRAGIRGHVCTSPHLPSASFTQTPISNKSAKF